MGFDINKFKSDVHQTSRYQKRLDELQKKGMDTACIECAVNEAVDNLHQGQTRAFVIYGEPQSGKTEMMIALTARLLDAGHKMIVHLLNDSVQLLEQNLDRFQRSGLAPSPCNFTSIMDPDIKVGDEEWVIFCKKNSRDLQKLIQKIEHIKKKIIIDDEADYATPNSKVNQGEKTRINDLIGNLLRGDGIYIGVTATPARLDLNNTFQNDHEKWVDFPPHKKYTGQKIFFPISQGSGSFNKFRITWIPDTGDYPEYCRNALLGFLVNTAYLNLHPERHKEGIQNYSFLVHTSGNKADHTRDYKIIQKVFGILSDPSNKDFESCLKQLWETAGERYPGKADDIVRYVRANIGCRNIVIMNSEKKDAAVSYKSATSPSSLFTVVIGGNIVSRGVTFDNLLSMYFTRDVKHKLQQDTYIQRARMFGSRGDYLDYFELTIPESLYLDWHRCFIFHRLSLEAIRSGKGAPVWLEDSRISAVSSASVDKSNVSLDSGEMSFSVFDYDVIENQVDAILRSNVDDNFAKLKKLQSLLGETNFPEFLLSYIQEFNPKGDSSIMLHGANSIAESSDADQNNISRKKGFMGGAAFTKNPDVTHHFRILFNAEKQARLFYKYSGKITFLKNLKNQSTKLAT